MSFYDVNPLLHPVGDQATWDVFCLICGAPSLNPAKTAKRNYGQVHPQQPKTSIISDLPHLSELAGQFGWLDSCIGIPEDNKPVELGLYDGQGDFRLPGDRLFGPYPSYAQAERTPNKQYGLNCHAKCYQLLRNRFAYTLQYQHIWPKLAAATDDSECLHSDYGGMTEYHEHEFAYTYMDEEKDGWMLLDPTCNERNAQRIVAVWMAVPEARFPTLIAVLCCFKRAAQLAEAETSADDTPDTSSTSSTASNSEKLMWKSMARIPASVLRTIIEKTYR